tara:strand:+ start:524 stop:664 length:141 start_codon:yes stop_codon:yes gene_type:complete
MYIEHVGQCEGTDFIDDIGFSSDIKFTEEEIDILNQLRYLEMNKQS